MSTATPSKVAVFSRDARSNWSEVEREMRRQLAACYRIFDHFGWQDTIYGHITMRLPGPEKHLLINPFGLRYDEVTASNLVKIDLEGNPVELTPYLVNRAGYIIHGAVHAARDDAHCVMHTHTRAGMAVAALRDGLKPISFAGARIAHEVAYHKFGGVHVDKSDNEALIASLGDRHMMIMKNHGLLACAPTLALCFRRLHVLETACDVQVRAEAMNSPLEIVPDDIVHRHAEAQRREDGELQYAALFRLMEKKDPSFLD